MDPSNELTITVEITAHEAERIATTRDLDPVAEQVVFDWLTLHGEHARLKRIAGANQNFTLEQIDLVAPDDDGVRRRIMARDAAEGFEESPIDPDARCALTIGFIAAAELLDFAESTTATRSAVAAALLAEYEPFVDYLRTFVDE